MTIKFPDISTWIPPVQDYIHHLSDGKQELHCTRQIMRQKNTLIMQTSAISKIQNTHIFEKFLQVWLKWIFKNVTNCPTPSPLNTYKNGKQQIPSMQKPFELEATKAFYVYDTIHRLILCYQKLPSVDDWMLLIQPRNVGNL